MKNLVSISIVIFALTVSAFAQNAAKTVAASEIVKQIEAGNKISYANVTVSGDLDLSNLSARTNDATYPERGKTARVYSAKISQPFEFKNVLFAGKVIFFRKEQSQKEIKEFRLVFADAVKFENCIFNDTANFELTNFDNTISFENSVFKAKPIFVRVGLEKIPNFNNAVFEQGSVFQNFQTDKPLDFSAEQLSGFYTDYIKSR